MIESEFDKYVKIFSGVNLTQQVNSLSYVNNAIRLLEDEPFGVREALRDIEGLDKRDNLSFMQKRIISLGIKATQTIQYLEDILQGNIVSSGISMKETKRNRTYWINRKNELRSDYDSAK